MINYSLYKNKNSKEWVTFVHGAGGSSSIWFRQIKEFKKHFNVKALLNQANQTTSFILTNQFGQTIFSGYLKFNNGTARVDVPSLNTGIYILTLRNAYKTQSFKLLGGAL